MGEYNSWHLYVLSKIHKNGNNPPLQAVFSLSGTVTRDIAYYTNQPLRKQ